MKDYSRDLRVEKNGKGYHLLGLGEDEIITPAEALDLLESLLHCVPEVTDGIKTSWELREAARVGVQRFYGCHAGEVKVTGYQAFIYYASGHTMLRTSVKHQESAAIAAARLAYGRPLECIPTEDCPGSKERAEQDLQFQKLEALAKAEGMSLVQWIHAHAGEEIHL